MVMCRKYHGNDVNDHVYDHVMCHGNDVYGHGNDVYDHGNDVYGHGNDHVYVSNVSW